MFHLLAASVVLATAPLQITAPPSVSRVDPLYKTKVNGTYVATPAQRVVAWDLPSFKKGVNPPAAFVDVTLKNTAAGTIAWGISNMPAWVTTPTTYIGGKPQLGVEFLHTIPKGDSQTVRFTVVPAVAAQFPVGKWRDEIGFYVSGSTAQEVTVECSLNVTP